MKSPVHVVLVAAVVVALIGCKPEPGLTSLDAGGEVSQPSGGGEPTQDGGGGLEPTPDAGSGVEPTTDGGSQPGADGGVTPVQTRPYELRLRGVNQEPFGYALLEIAEVRAEVEGNPLTVHLQSTAVNLAEPEHAWLIATVEVPVTASEVAFLVRFDDVGAYETAGLAGAVEARHVTVQWKSDLASLQLHGRAVVHLDVAESLAVLPSGQRQLLPILSVHH